MKPLSNPPIRKKEPDKEPKNNSNTEPQINKDTEIQPEEKQKKDVAGESSEQSPISSKKKDPSSEQ